MLLNLESHLGDEAYLLTDDLVQLLVLIVGIRREIFIQVVLRNRVYNVVCHTCNFFL